MTSLDAMKALAGTDSKRINDAINGDVAKHRDKLSWLKGQGADPTSLAAYEGSTNQLEQLLKLSQMPASVSGTGFDPSEKKMLLEQGNAAGKASVADFKLKLADTTTVSGAAKAGDAAKATTTETLMRREGESMWRHGVTGERVGESIDGSTAKGNEERRMTRADGENVWRDEKTGKPVVDVSSAAVKRAEAEPTGGKAAAAAEKDTRAGGANDPYKTSGGKTYREGPTLDEVKSGKRAFFEGDKGEGVKELQTKLKAAGHDIEADGLYGPKTQAAVEAEKEKLLPGNSKGILKGVGIDGDDLKRMDAKAAGKTASPAKAATTAASTANDGGVKEGADTRKERLGHADIDGVATRMKDAFAAGGTDQVNSLLGKMNGAELAAVREKIGTKELEKMVGGTRTTTKSGGQDDDYKDAVRAAAFSDRKSLNASEVSAFTKQLKEADTDDFIGAQLLKGLGIGLGGAGTNEEQVNKLFKLDNASLQKVDAELRESYPGGLRAFINANYSMPDDLTNDLFSKRFDAAGIAK